MITRATQECFYHPSQLKIRPEIVTRAATRTAKALFILHIINLPHVSLYRTITEFTGHYKCKIEDLENIAYLCYKEVERNDISDEVVKECCKDLILRELQNPKGGCVEIINCLWKFSHPSCPPFLKDRKMGGHKKIKLRKIFSDVSEERFFLQISTTKLTARVAVKG